MWASSPVLSGPPKPSARSSATNGARAIGVSGSMRKRTGSDGTTGTQGTRASRPEPASASVNVWSRTSRSAAKRYSPWSIGSQPPIVVSRWSEATSSSDHDQPARRVEVCMAGRPPRRARRV